VIVFFFSRFPRVSHLKCRLPFPLRNGARSCICQEALSWKPYFDVAQDYNAGRQEPSYPPSRLVFEELQGHPRGYTSPRILPQKWSLLYVKSVPHLSILEFGLPITSFLPTEQGILRFQSVLAVHLRGFDQIQVITLPIQLVTTHVRSPKSPNTRIP